MRVNLAAIPLVVATIAIGCTVFARAESPGDSGAEASRREAKVYTDWPFGTVEALRRQAETAAALGVPVEVTDSIGIKLRLIPAGEFVMGSPDNEPERRDDEGPLHRVRITKPFYSGVYEVTQEQYVQLTGSNPSKFAGKTNPVEVVNWKEATEFCAKLSAKEGVEYRLPTEAQWEWACRAGTATPFSFGYATDGTQANNNGKYPYDANARPPYDDWKTGPNQQRTTVVGSYRPNAWGLYDMHGNVSEWCADWYDASYYATSPVDDPSGPTSGKGHARRGGSWRWGGLEARAAYRFVYYSAFSDFRSYDLGFRVVRLATSADPSQPTIASPPTGAKIPNVSPPSPDVPKSRTGAGVPTDDTAKPAEDRKDFDRASAARPKAAATPLDKARTAETNSNPPPGVVIARSPDPKQVYFSSPSIAVLPDGRYVASHDFYRAGAGKNRTSLFRSDDAGKTWKPLTFLLGQRSSTLFVHNKALYIMGTSGEYSSVVIRRSDDGGQTWTEPADERTGLLHIDGPTALLRGDERIEALFRVGEFTLDLNDAGYSTAPVPLVVHAGRIWRAMEDNGAGAAWGGRFRAIVMSAPVDADLLDAKNWTTTNRLASRTNPEAKPARGGGWLDGNVVVTPEGKLVDILRTADQGTNLAAIASVSDDGKTISFDPKQDFVDFPGGSNKFTIRYDPTTKRYWALVNKETDPPAYRNVLALTSSADLRDWRVETIVLRHIESPRHAFSYVDWLFDGDDIIAVSRTAWDGATNAQNANYLTFHRIADFRHRTLADSPEWLGMRKDKKTIPFDDFSIEGARFTMEKLVDDAQAYANKPYVWKEIPPQYSGWTYTRITGGINNNFNSLLVVRAMREAVLYMATAPSLGKVEMAGWQQVEGASFYFTDETSTRLNVYRRNVVAGQEVAVTNMTWSSAIVLIPPKAP